MYVFGPSGFGQSGDAPPSPHVCAGWMSDPQSFSKVVADHYLRTEFPALASQASRIWCAEGKEYCMVYYPNGVQVMVSFVELPRFVIARRVRDATSPRREYDFTCLPTGQLVLKKRAGTPG